MNSHKKITRQTLKKRTGEKEGWTLSGAPNKVPFHAGGEKEGGREFVLSPGWGGKPTPPGGGNKQKRVVRDPTRPLQSNSVPEKGSRGKKGRFSFPCKGGYWGGWNTPKAAERAYHQLSENNRGLIP